MIRSRMSALACLVGRQTTTAELRSARTGGDARPYTGALTASFLRGLRPSPRASFRNVTEPQPQLTRGAPLGSLNGKSTKCREFPSGGKIHPTRAGLAQ